MNWYRKWRLRRAQEQYAEFKARREMLEKHIHPWRMAELVHAAGREAQYMERVEILMREECK